MVFRSTWLQCVVGVLNAIMLTCFNQAGSAVRLESPRSTNAAQATPTNSGGPSAQLADLRKDWRAQKDVMVKLADAMPAEKFGYKPTPAQRTFGEQIMHVAVGNVAMIKLLGGTRKPPFEIDGDRSNRMGEDSAKALTKQQIVKALSDAYDFGDAVLADQTPESINMVLSKDLPFFTASTRARVIWSLLSHAMDIYGQMVVYVRLNGIVPPASRGI